MNTDGNHQLQNIADWLKKVKFKRVYFGGVSEQDVWKKIEQLNEMYEVALVAERARYDALLSQQCGSSSHKSLETDSSQEAVDNE